MSLIPTTEVGFELVILKKSRLLDVFTTIRSRIMIRGVSEQPNCLDAVS